MSGYGLTGCIFASERRVINKAADGLRYAQPSAAQVIVDVR
jgi:hypothetical protein